MAHSPLGVLGAADRPLRLADLGALRRSPDPLFAKHLQASARARGRVFERDGFALFALGTSARLRFANGVAHDNGAQLALEALQSIERMDGARPLLLGALPFAPTACAELAIPTACLRIEDGRAELTLTAGHDRLEALAASPDQLLGELGSPVRAPDRFELVSALPHEDFLELVERAVATVESGALDKVVVAREVTVRANRAFEAGDLLGRLRALYPSCAAFSLDGFVGASPELLCRRVGQRIVAHPLAGTVARSGDPDEDARLAADLLASAKDRHEHRIVVDAIAGELEKIADRVDAAQDPHLLELRNVVHLATAIEAECSGVAPGALEVAALLHPTPAVGGWPREEALAWLRSNEPLERDRYAGPLGYMDASGDGEFFLGIRSAILDGRVARLLAGVGIVPGSDPRSELVETQLKLQALLAAAVRP